MSGHEAHDQPVDECGKYLCPGFTEIREAVDVTDEIVDIVVTYREGYEYDDWMDTLDRMDGLRLLDGTILDMGTEIDTPAERKIRREVRKRLG